jgi:hypothetical protein
MKTNIMNTKYIWMLLICLGFVACNDPEDFVDDPIVPDVVLPPLTSGSADFSKFVSIGASFTAGYSDLALFNASQQNSFPNIMAEQFAKAGGGLFTQPMMSGNFGGLAIGGTRIADPRLVFGGAGPVPLESLIGPVTVATDIAINNPTGPFNNMGVPGAKSFHLLAPVYGNIAGVLSGQANPYFVRMASSPTTNVLTDAMIQGPTFFSLSEVGAFDILDYAIAGGSGIDQTGNFDPSTYGGSDITDPNVFAQAFGGMVTALVSTGANGVVTNIPNVTDLPHFTTVPYNAVPLDAGTANLVNQGYAAYNGGLQQAFAALAGTGLFPQEELDRRTINFVEGQNAVVIVDEDLTDLGAINPAFAALPKYRQATAEDLLVLLSLNFIGTTVGGNPSLINGVSVPLADQWVLTPEEQSIIQAATDNFNATISGVASANGLALVDLNQILNQATTTGIPFDDYTLTGEFVTGGIFSLDGIHLSARGSALLANKFLEAIDTTYGSNFVASGNVAKANDYNIMYSPGL